MKRTVWIGERECKVKISKVQLKELLQTHNTCFLIGFQRLEDYNQIITIPEPIKKESVAISKQMADLGIVFKSSTIIETIEDVLRKNGDIK